MVSACEQVDGDKPAGFKTPCAVYRHFDADGQLLYVGISQDPRSRLYQHKSRSRWFDQIANVAVKWMPNREDAAEAEAKAIREERPLFNGGEVRRGEPNTGDPLRDWMAETNTSQTDIALAYGVHKTSVSQILKGNRRASLRFAVFIEDMSEGAVPARYWLFGATAEHHQGAQGATALAAYKTAQGLPPSEGC